MMTLQGVKIKQHYITAEGTKELKQRLEDLRRTRAQIADDLRDLSSQNSVSSNMYDHAQTVSNTQASEIEAQINMLERIIATAKIVSKPSVAHRAEIGSVVEVSIGGKRQTYTIVGSIEADPIKGRISNESPLGKSLLGKAVGDSFEITPRGRLPIQATIAKIL